MVTLTWRYPFTFVILLLLLAGSGCQPLIPQRDGWQLIWHDEFDGEALDPQNWTYDIGGDGWGNSELEYYTNRPENVRVADGNLVIEARAEKYGGRQYTSARLKSQYRQAWQYGRIEARIKIPRGQGIWPAFWLLGDNIDQVGWPACGEIDVMEVVGKEPATVYGTMHGPINGAHIGLGDAHSLPNGQLADEYHLYAIEWEADQIRWYLDDINYFTGTAAEFGGDWVFDHPHFLLLNIAVGGNWPGSPNRTTLFPQQMLVDYVRVYQRATAN